MVEQFSYIGLGSDFDENHLPGSDVLGTTFSSEEEARRDMVLWQEETGYRGLLLKRSVTDWEVVPNG